MKIHINEPWWGAYKKFGWGDKIPGIGFSQRDILRCIEAGEKVVVSIGNDKETLYEISPVTVQNLSKKYNSTYKARLGVVLLVVPQNELKKIQLTD